MRGIELPVRACKRTFQRFEKQNPGVSLSVFLYEGGDIVPKYVDGLNVHACRLIYYCSTTGATLLTMCSLRTSLTSSSAI